MSGTGNDAPTAEVQQYDRLLRRTSTGMTTIGPALQSFLAYQAVLKDYKGSRGWIRYSILVEL